MEHNEHVASRQLAHKRLTLPISEHPPNSSHPTRALPPLPQTRQGPRAYPDTRRPAVPLAVLILSAALILALAWLYGGTPPPAY